jgi:hypothetical protein
MVDNETGPRQVGTYMPTHGIRLHGMMHVNRRLSVIIMQDSGEKTNKEWM